MQKIKLTDLLIFVVAAELVGAVSALFSGGNFREYYDALVRPPIAPPGWVFPVAWGLLYALMGTAAYLVYLNAHDLRTAALKLYLLQLFVNFLWSPVFFGAKQLIPAAVIAGVLLVTVTLTTVAFFRVSETAGALMLPYLCWSAYALYLSVGYAVLN